MVDFRKLSEQAQAMRERRKLHMTQETYDAINGELAHARTKYPARGGLHLLDAMHDQMVLVSQHYLANDITELRISTFVLLALSIRFLEEVVPALVSSTDLDALDKDTRK